MKHTIVTLLILALGGSARAQSLAEKKDMQEGEAYVAKALKVANEECGAKITASIDWNSFAGMYKPHDGPTEAGGSCSAVLEAMQRVCSGHPEAKAAIAQKIHSVTCKFDKAGTRTAKCPSGKPGLGESGNGGFSTCPTIDLKAGALTAGYVWDTSNLKDEADDWLRKNL
jgi:hypothetical protein